MSHRNAALTPIQRLRLARLIVDEGWPVAHAATFFHVSWPTAKRWAERYEIAGPAGMEDRSSRPHHILKRTPQLIVRKIVHLRWKKRLGPIGIGAKLHLPASTVHAVLVRVKLNRLHHVDVRTGEPVRRYEHDQPGSMIHVDVKKIGLKIEVSVPGSHLTIVRNAMHAAGAVTLVHMTGVRHSGVSREHGVHWTVRNPTRAP